MSVRRRGHHRKTYGLDVIVGEIFDDRLQPASFDLITMWSVLEHVPDPLAVVARCRSLLRPGGVLAFYVPNFRSVNAALFRNRWYHMDAPRHLSIFSPRSARRLLDSAGMELMRIDYDRSVWGILGCLQYSVWPAGRALFSIPDSRLFRVFCLPASFTMGLFGVSDTITVYAESR
jgi:SAM-dependent methyltransferase